jgi:hypothetical protein
VENNPLTHSDPTGHWEEDDSHLSEADQALIRGYTRDYVTAEAYGLTEAMQIAHDKAVAVRKNSGRYEMIQRTDYSDGSVTSIEGNLKLGVREDTQLEKNVAVNLASCATLNIAVCAGTISSTVEDLKADNNDIYASNSTTPWNIKDGYSDKVKYGFNGQDIDAYQDPRTGLYWSKDVTKHSDSAYKVFERSGKELIWVKDADINGNYILDKHKSEVGKRVRIK